MLLFLMHPQVAYWYLPVLAVVAAAALVGWELRAANPFLDLRILAGNRPLLATYARSLLTAVSSYALLYGYTQWLEQGRGLSASAAGLVLLPIFGTGILVSTVTGRRPEIRGKLAVGAATPARPPLQAPLGIFPESALSPVSASRHSGKMHQDRPPLGTFPRMYK